CNLQQSMELYARVLRQIMTHRMFKPNDRVIAAVSGGPDSVALANLLCEIRKERWPALQLRLAHLNHRLRGEESGRAEAFVAELALGLGLELTVERVPVAELREGRNLEEAARIHRYRFLQRVAEETHSAVVATGHNMNDQAETLLMRLLRGAGTAGLAGIRPTADIKSLIGSEESDGLENYSCRVVRPLLSITRDEIELYLNERGVKARIDSSNLSTRITRNRIRLEIMPRLLEINPRATEAIARAAEILREDSTYPAVRLPAELE